MSMNEVQRRLVLDWMRKVHRLEYAHRYASLTKERLNWWLGIPAAVISSVIAAQVTAPWLPNERVQAAIGLGATLIAILVGLQTFLKPSEASEKHRSASAAYEDLRHRLELILSFEESPKKVVEELARLKAEWDRLETPNVSARAWRRAKEQLDKIGTYPEALRL
jgi:hypothetical protein